MVMISNEAQAQPGNNNNNFGSVIGGVKIDTSNVLTGETQVLGPELREKLQQQLGSADPDIGQAAQWRVISLRGLETAIAAMMNEDQPLPPEMIYMAGLQRVECVMLDDANNDILIAGPAEGWEVDRNGRVVGSTTRQPVIHLQDFLVALRCVENARQGQGISISIDPSEEGAQRLSQLYRQQGFTPAMKEQVEEAMGPQQISLTGVPEDSRFAQILTAADYRMKRYSMGLDAAPIENMPSLLEIVKNNNATLRNASPRFWMECNYEPVAVNEDNTIWQIRGQGVKTLTEDGFFNRDGEVETRGTTNKFAQQWADSMTERFEELSAADPSLRELRNLMDMSVIGAIIAREGLLERAGLEIPMLAGTIETPSWNVPKTVASQCSFIQLRNAWMVTASGGVQVDSWSVAENLEAVTETAEIFQVAANRTAGDRWWWNAN